MADIIPIRRMAEPKWWIHACGGTKFYLRDDGAIVCVKCEMKVGEWQM